jgi:hypothetical protein
MAASVSRPFWSMNLNTLTQIIKLFPGCDQFWLILECGITPWLAKFQWRECHFLDREYQLIQEDIFPILRPLVSYH